MAAAQLADMEKERKEVEAYLNKHELGAYVSDAVNKAVKQRPEHPLGVIASALLDDDSKRGITGVSAREILDSNGVPTVEVEVTTPLGKYTATAPSAELPTAEEGMELRDTEDSRYGSKGVTAAVDNVNETIAPALIGVDPTKQRAIDEKLQKLDGTTRKSTMGANACIAVSMACCRAGAAYKKVPLYRHIADLAGVEEVCMPVPAFNMIMGGAEAGNKLVYKEFLLMPTKADTYAEALRIGSETHARLRDLIIDRYGKESALTGPEGQYAPAALETPEEALQLMSDAAEAAGYLDMIKFAINVDARHMHVTKAQLEEEEEARAKRSKKGKKGKKKEEKGSEEEKGSDKEKYDTNFKLLDGEERQLVNSASLTTSLMRLCERYPVVSIEDPFAPFDWEAFADFTEMVGDSVQVLGGHLLRTRPEVVEVGVDNRSCTGILVKPSQAGTVSETLAACKLARAANWGIMISHRFGETMDDFISDLAVGLRAGQIKSGSPFRMERMAKYNRLLHIEDELGEDVLYVGSQFRRPPEV